MILFHYGESWNLLRADQRLIFAKSWPRASRYQQGHQDLFNGYYINGIDHEAVIQSKNIDNYFLFIKQKIESFNFNEALKQQILKDISLCSYEGLHVLKIEIKSVGEVCHFENRYYIRQGTATHLITDGEAISSLHRLYYS